MKAFRARARARARARPFRANVGHGRGHGLGHDGAQQRRGVFIARSCTQTDVSGRGARRGRASRLADHLCWRGT